MRKMIRIVLILAGALFAENIVPSKCSAEAFTFDPGQGEAVFTYYIGPVAQSGRFTGLNGKVEFDPDRPQRSAIEAVISTASLRASRWEAELKGSDFFNVAVYPQIRFKAQLSRVTADGAEFTGDLTLNGITRQIALNVNFEGVAPLSKNAKPNIHTLSASGRILRSHYNMNALRFLVDDQIDLQISVALLPAR